MAANEHSFGPFERPAQPAAAASLELECLYRQHHGRVRAICLALLHDRDGADDAVQQVFLSALRSLQHGTVPQEAGAWLATIARHECWARARRPAVAPLRVSVEDRTEDLGTTAERSAELAETWRTIGDLPARQREALLLREVGGLGYDELAERLELSRPAIRSLLMRARRTVRMRLQRGTAALTGAPWVNLLTRCFGDGSNPALSSITRTAAVGLGAVALTGGAVVAPRLAGHHRHARTAPPRASAARSKVAARPQTLAAAAPARTAGLDETRAASAAARSGSAGADDRRSSGGQPGVPAPRSDGRAGGERPGADADGAGTGSAETSGGDSRDGGPTPGSTSTSGSTSSSSGGSESGGSVSSGRDGGPSGGPSGESRDSADATTIVAASDGGPGPDTLGQSTPGSSDGSGSATSGGSTSGGSDGSGSSGGAGSGSSSDGSGSGGDGGSDGGGAGLDGSGSDGRH